MVDDAVEGVEAVEEDEDEEEKEELEEEDDDDDEELEAEVSPLRRKRGAATSGRGSKKEIE